MVSGGDGFDKDEDNVVDLKSAQKKRALKEKEQKQTPSKWANLKDTGAPDASHEPIINMPPFTKYFLGIIISIHLIVIYVLDDKQAYEAIIHLGFIPGRFTGEAIFEPLALITPFTHMLLHGGWLHIAMNGVMLLAFGSGVERWMGGKKMIAFFVLCGLFGVAAHFALNPFSIAPMIGASGGLSGLFAAAIIMINRKSGGTMAAGRYGIWPFVGIWIGISILFGLMGSPDGSAIAWAAHVGGFLGGFAVLKLMKI